MTISNIEDMELQEVFGRISAKGPSWSSGLVQIKDGFKDAPMDALKDVVKDEHIQVLMSILSHQNFAIFRGEDRSEIRTAILHARPEHDIAQCKTRQPPLEAAILKTETAESQGRGV